MHRLQMDEPVKSHQSWGSGRTSLAQAGVHLQLEARAEWW
jgi:hypothetical protein